MSELDVIQKLKDRILPKLPTQSRPQVEIEIQRVHDEVSLRHDVLSCTACALSESCTNKVPGAGPTEATVMLVGESPGEHEDREGVPFIGPGGELLTKALEAAGWNREDLYITNIVKCHTEENRKPTTSEIAACFQHIKKEIDVVQPRIIITLGSMAANTLIHPDFKITQENGHWFELNPETRAMAIYHPSYLLRLGEGTERQKQAKWEVFNALKKAKDYQVAGYQDNFG